MIKIEDYLRDITKYKVDETYQREEGVWSRQDKQCLIDTILKNEPMPMIFLNYINKEDIFYIVDGQQRLSVIRDFHAGKFKLSKMFSGEDLDGKKFEDLDDNMKKNFLEYKIYLRVMEDYNDEKVRMIFSRLQRGKQLRLGEKINAKPGVIVETVRKIAKHKFLTHSTDVAKNRFVLYEDVARILLYEVHGAKDYSTDTINNFFEVNKSIISIDSTIYQNIINTLNILLRCFPAENGPYAHLEKHTWVLTVFTVINDMKKQYSLIGRELEIGDFIKRFHAKIYNPAFRQGDLEYTRFYDSVRGGWSEKLIIIRRDILKSQLLKEFDFKELAVKRQISNEEKIQIFSTKDCCEECGKKFKDYKEPEYHHVEYYSEGGDTVVENIIPLCAECHDKVHASSISNMKINSVTDEDLEINEDE